MIRIDVLRYTSDSKFIEYNVSSCRRFTKIYYKQYPYEDFSEENWTDITDAMSISSDGLYVVGELPTETLLPINNERVSIPKYSFLYFMFFTEDDYLEDNQPCCEDKNSAIGVAIDILQFYKCQVKKAKELGFDFCKKPCSDSFRILNNIQYMESLLLKAIRLEYWEDAEMWYELINKACTQFCGSINVNCSDENRPLKNNRCNTCT